LGTNHFNEPIASIIDGGHFFYDNGTCPKSFHRYTIFAIILYARNPHFAIAYLNGFWIGYVCVGVDSSCWEFWTTNNDKSWAKMVCVYWHTDDYHRLTLDDQFISRQFIKEGL